MAHQLHSTLEDDRASLTEIALRKALVEEIQATFDEAKCLSEGLMNGLKRFLKWKFRFQTNAYDDSNPFNMLATMFKSKEFDASFMRQIRANSKLSDKKARELIKLIKKHCPYIPERLGDRGRDCAEAMKFIKVYESTMVPSDKDVKKLQKELAEVKANRESKTKLYFSPRTDATFEEVLRQTLDDDSNNDLFKGLHNLVKIQSRRFEGMLCDKMEHPESISDKDIDACAESVRKIWDTLGKFQLAADLLKNHQEQLAESVQKNYEKYMQKFDGEERQSLGTAFDSALNWLKQKATTEECEPCTIIDVEVAS